MAFPKKYEEPAKTSLLLRFHSTLGLFVGTTGTGSTPKLITKFID